MSNEAMSPGNELENLRNQVDAADKAVLEALAQRMGAVKKIGVYKQSNNLPPLDQERWKIVLESRKKMAASLGISEEFAEKLYELIHEEALRIEDAIKSSEHDNQP